MSSENKEASKPQPEHIQLHCNVLGLFLAALKMIEETQ